MSKQPVKPVTRPILNVKPVTTLKPVTIPVIKPKTNTNSPPVRTVTIPRISPKTSPKVTSFITADKIEEDTVIELAETLDKYEFDDLMKILSSAYYNETALVSDKIFDAVQNLYESKFGKYEVIGAEPTGEMVNLPHFLSSLDKKNTNEELNRYKKNYPGPYILMDKINGSSILLTNRDDSISLYTRGGGVRGKDVSHLTNYIRMPQLDEDIDVRGEMVLTKSAFAKIGGSDALAVGNGIINSQKSLTIEHAKQLQFYPFRIMNSQHTVLEDLEYLQELGFNVPQYKIVDDFTKESLDELYLERKEKAEYDIDGITIYQNAIIDYPGDKNPKQVIAFKSTDNFEIKETTVTHIIWESTREKELFPRVYYESINFTGASEKGKNNSRASGRNARFIEDNIIGPGAKILVRYNIVPEIFEVLQVAPDGPEYPDKTKYGDYDWDANHVRFILKDDNNQVLARKILHFLNTLEIKHLGEVRARALVDAGVDDLTKLLNSTPEQLIGPNIGNTTANNLYNDLREKLTDVSLAKIMDASGLFPGIGERRFEMILEVYPDLLNFTDDGSAAIAAKLREVKGIDKMSEVIAKILPKFMNWLEAHPMITVLQPEMELKTKNARGNKLAGQTIVFTGFVGNDLKPKVIAEGGKMGSSVTKTTTLLVLKDLSDETWASTKGKAAQKLGTKYMSLTEFNKTYFS